MYNPACQNPNCGHLKTAHSCGDGKSCCDCECRQFVFSEKDITFTKNELNAIDRILKHIKPIDPHVVYLNEPGFYIYDDFERLAKVRQKLERISS